MNIRPEKTEIFISYRREDGRDLARNLQLELNLLGYKNVFFDYDSIHEGKFDFQILKAIENCTDFLLIMTPKSMLRCGKPDDWVATEIRKALEVGCNFIPIFVNQEFDFENNMPKDFPEDLKFSKENARTIHTDDTFHNSVENLVGFLHTERTLTITQKGVWSLLVITSLFLFGIAGMHSWRTIACGTIIQHPTECLMGLLALVMLTIWLTFSMTRKWKYLKPKRKICSLIPLLGIITGLTILSWSMPALSKASLSNKIIGSKDIPLLKFAHEIGVDDAAYLLAEIDTANTGFWFTEARKIYEKIQAEDSTDVNSALHLTYLYMKGQGGTIDIATATKYSRRALNTKRGAGLYTLLTIYQNDTTEYFRQMERFQILWSDSSDVFLQLAELQYKINDSLTVLDKKDTLHQYINSQMHYLDSISESTDKEAADEARYFLLNIIANGVVDYENHNSAYTPSFFVFHSMFPTIYESTDPRLALAFDYKYGLLGDKGKSEQCLLRAWHLGNIDAALILAQLIKSRKHEPPYKQKLMEIVKEYQNKHFSTKLYFYNTLMEQGKGSQAMRELEGFNIPAGTHLIVRDTTLDDDCDMDFLMKEYKKTFNEALKNDTLTVKTRDNLRVFLDVALTYADGTNTRQTAECLFEMARLLTLELCTGVSSIEESEAYSNFILYLISLSGSNDPSKLLSRVQTIHNQASQCTPPEEMQIFDNQLQSIISIVNGSLQH